MIDSCSLNKNALNYSVYSSFNNTDSNQQFMINKKR